MQLDEIGDRILVHFDKQDRWVVGQAVDAIACSTSVGLGRHHQRRGLSTTRLLRQADDLRQTADHLHLRQLPGNRFLLGTLLVDRALRSAQRPCNLAALCQQQPLLFFDPVHLVVGGVFCQFTGGLGKVARRLRPLLLEERHCAGVLVDLVVARGELSDQDAHELRRDRRVIVPE